MVRIPVGKLGTAPCGHSGEHITANYVQCLQGCEASAEVAPAMPACPHCGSSDLDLDYSLGEMYLFWNPTAIDYNRRCWGCGHVWRESR